MRLLALLALLAFAFSFGTLMAAPVPKEKAKDEDAIVGTWLVEKIDYGVDGLPQREGVGKMKVRFENGGKAVPIDANGKELREGTYKLDATASPKRIDMSADKVDQLGVYELEGDTLKVALPASGFSQKRPTEVKAVADGVLLMTLTRVKDEKKEEKKVKDEPKKDK